MDVMMMGPAPGRMGLVSGSRLEPGAVCARIDFWKWMTGLYRRARSWNGRTTEDSWMVGRHGAGVLCVPNLHTSNGARNGGAGVGP